jgi:type II secretory pathway pseudopilin PulG
VVQRKRISQWLLMKGSARPLNYSTPNLMTVQQAAGFSLVETMLATFILAVVTSGTLALYTSYTKSLQINRRENQIQAAIASDVATVLRTNRRITCSSGSCTINGADPGENAYSPDPLNSSATTYFTTLCSSQTLVNQVISLIDQQSRPAAFTDLGITRDAATAEQYTTTPTRSGHRYVVTWSRSISGQTVPLRQITLTPTVANWCP